MSVGRRAHGGGRHMFDRILVPVDGSSRATEAIEMARHLAERFAAQLVIQRVEGAMTSLEQALADDQAMDQRVHDLRHHGVDAHYTIEFGRPSKAIANRAKSE